MNEGGVGEVGSLAEIIGALQKGVGRCAIALSSARIKQLVQPAFDSQSHFCQVSSKEMIAGDEHQLLRFRRAGHYFFHGLVRAELVVIAAEKELGLAAVGQKLVRVEATFSLYRRAQ